MYKIEVLPGKWKVFWAGIGLMLLGIFMPSVLNVHNFGVIPAVFRALSENKDIALLEAGARLWGLNTIRAIPHYLGAFFLADAVFVQMNGNEGPLVKCGVMGIMILSVYRVIEFLYGIQYDIGVPAICMIIFLILLTRIDFRMVSAVKKAIIVMFLVGTFQCLDVMPALEGYGFGRGETSQMIKDIAGFMEVENALNCMLFCLMVLMFLNFLLYSVLVADEKHIRQANMEKEAKMREMANMQVKMIEFRSHTELKNLVHDLKTPLTSILTLTGIVKLTSDKEKQDIYLSRIEMSVENLNEQISEILDEEKLVQITLEDFMNGLSAQISHMPYGNMVTMEVENPNERIAVNRIRAYRMIINLVENAYYAVDQKDGKIVCRVRSSQKNGEKMAEFIVEDNGCGMEEETMKCAFESGYSSRGSSGLGLSFVQTVVECHRGLIEIESVLHEGTKIHIWLPEESE